MQNIAFFIQKIKTKIKNNLKCRLSEQQSRCVSVPVVDDGDRLDQHGADEVGEAEVGQDEVVRHDQQLLVLPAGRRSISRFELHYSSC